MRLAQWFAVVGVMAVLGVSLVAERNAVFRASYAVGERVRRLHAEEMQVAWQRTRVIGLSSPAALSDAEQSRGLKFVARALLGPSRDAAGQFVQLAAATADKGD